ncbi:MAG TPA: gephyrin-like molybdotransferase Glp [Thermoleophilaceae bacterium]|nr:gephyrin-like molybdotransferase Glp [Thermoleophilaceae bacterium]
MTELISIDEGRARVLDAVQPLDIEDAALTDALDRVVARDIASPRDVPPFDNSAMDGFAVRAGPPAELEVVGESRAGRPSPAEVGQGQAIRISTGAALPAGASAVVPVERARALDEAGERVWVDAAEEGANVLRAGEDVRAGDVVLRKGAVLGPAELGVAASIGCDVLPCARRPRVAVLVTGDELAEPGDPLGPGRIYSSNAFALGALVERSHATLVRGSTVRDDAESTRAALERALEEADVVCVSGGVSVGPHDHVKPALRELGVAERFWGVALRPGKPTWFGSRDRALVFGLPGNPVSAMVTFQLFVRPALAALQGAPAAPTRVAAVLDDPVPLLPLREQAVRVRLSAHDGGWHAAVTGEQGSHMLTSMLGADGLALVALGEGEAKPGTPVEVELL